MKRPVNALVSGAGGVYGDATIRALLQSSGIEAKIVAIDCDASASGLYLAHEAHVVPVATADNYVPVLEKICERHEIDIIFVASGSEIPLMSQIRDKIGERTGAFVVVNSPGLLEITNDKWATYEALKRGGIDVPASTIQITSEALRDFVDSVGFPIIVKPRFGSGGRGISYPTDLECLTAAMDAGEPMVAQRAIGDEHLEYTVGVLGTEEGTILGSITLRRYLKKGMTYAAEVVNDPRIRAYAEGIASLLEPRGYCNIQLRMDGDSPIAFEVNGRISSSTAFRTAAGFNEPEILIRYYLFDETPSSAAPKPLHIIRAHDERVVDDDRWALLHDN